MGNPVVHFEIGGRDSKKLGGFYSKLFGWEVQSYGGAAQMIDTGASAAGGGTAGINGHINQLGHEPHNYCVIYVQVDDIPAATKKAESLGGQSLVPMTEVPGMGHFSWLKDPEGNMFGLWKPMMKS